MSRVAAIGEPRRVHGLALAGVIVYETDDADSVSRAWRGLPDDVVAVILTPIAAAGLEAQLLTETKPMRVVMPP